ncbi:hypothetical protein L1887_44147 [Cichorium endivia]|nr:hypothetical protein L1887_44147 [Cichorium endivia]
MPGDGREIAVAKMLTLNQARFVFNPDFKAALQRAVAKGLTDHRASKAVQLPRQQRAGGLQMKNGAQRGIRAGEDNGVLRQPLQSGIFVEVKMLVKTRLRAAAAIELARPGHGDERVAFGVQPNGNVQRIAAHNPAGRVQQVKVAGFPFGVKRTLNGERPDVVGGVQEGFLRGVTKLQGKRRLPAFIRIISDLSC